jgi:hypothetical protein
MSSVIDDYLSRRSRPEFENVPPPSVPSEDDVTMVSPEEAAEFYDECLAGHTLMIEYCDAAGATSRRAITIRSFRSGQPGYMNALCHERRAFRCFRLDRVLAVFDRHGEVFEPAESYFSQRFGLIGFGLFSPGMETEAEVNKRILNMVRPGLYCLSALAGADRFLHVEEVEALLQFCDHRCDAAGIRLDDSHVDMLSRHIERFLVPDAKALTNAAIQLAGSSALPLFYRYARQVLEADGDIDLAESEMYLAIRAVIDAATTSSESTF